MGGVMAMEEITPTDCPMPLLGRSMLRSEALTQCALNHRLLERH